MLELLKPRRRGRFEAPAKPSAEPPKGQVFLLLYLWLALALPELVLHISTAGPGLLMSSGLLLGPLFALVPALLMTILCSSLPRRGYNYAAALVYSLLCWLFCGSQLVYHHIFGTFYTFFSMTNGAGAFQFAATITAALTACWLPLVLMALPTLALLTLIRKPIGFQQHRSVRSKAVLALLAVTVHFAAVFALPWLGGTADTTAYGLYHNASDAYLGVNRLGLFTAFRLDMTRTLTGNSASGSIVLSDTPATVWVP